MRGRQMAPHWVREDGQAMVEYGLLLALLVVAALAALPGMWWATLGIYQSIVQVLSGLVP